MKSKLKIDLILHSLSNTAPWDHPPATYDFRSDTFPHTGPTCSTTWMIPPRWVVKREWDCVGRTSGTWVCGRVTSCCFVCEWQAGCGPLMLHSSLVWKVTDLDLFYTHTHTQAHGDAAILSRVSRKILNINRKLSFAFYIYIHIFITKLRVLTLSHSYLRLWLTEVSQSFMTEKEAWG